MCFRRICSWGVNAIRLVRVISCQPVRVETESMNFSEDSMFYKLYIYQGNNSLYKIRLHVQNKIACAVQVSFGLVLVLMSVLII